MINNMNSLVRLPELPSGFQQLIAIQTFISNNISLINLLDGLNYLISVNRVWRKVYDM